MALVTNQGLDEHFQRVVQSLSARLASKQIECKVENDVTGELDCSSFSSAVEIVLNLAIDNSPERSTILISSVQTTNSIEVEIADASLGENSSNHTQQVLAKAKVAVAHLSGRVDVMNCAQGGKAYVISIPVSKTRAAA